MALQPFPSSGRLHNGTRDGTEQMRRFREVFWTSRTWAPLPNPCSREMRRQFATETVMPGLVPLTPPW